MKNRLQEKLSSIRSNPNTHEFIIADAKDADMAWGVPSPGSSYPAKPGSNAVFRTMPEFHQQIREIVRQGIVDIMLGSVSTMSLLAHREALFANSDVTPAIRANDTTDVWCVRGGRYRDKPSQPFSTCFIAEAQYGSITASRANGPVVNLGLYSATFNNDLDADRKSLLAFKTFRAEAQQFGFKYFLEVFAPNVNGRMSEEEVPFFVNDHICRMLAAVPLDARPEFLKIPYFNPGALEELAAYDPSMVVGILGGSSGTTYDAFKLIAEAQQHGARVALFGRKIKDAEDPLTFITYLRRIVDGEITPKEAVKAYHGELQGKKIPPRRALADDLQLTTAELSYAR